MSASLVGSEMCIRDRRKCVHTCTLAQALSQQRTPVREGARAHAPTAVSYTHLTLPTICSV
eukprot:15290018-Alexandrium_andersonii.AAC.1